MTTRAPRRGSIKRMYSIRDIQELLGVGYATAHRIMQEIPHIDLAAPGGQLRLLRCSENALRKYMEARTR